jgi:NADH-ubiquinone oxidoreductase chain 5
MYILVIFLPLISFFVLIVAGHQLGKQGSIVVALMCLFSSLVFSFIIFYEVGVLGFICTFKLTNWICTDVLNIHWGFLYDSLTVSMLFIVILISFLVHLYSISYMEYDPFIIRFISFLSLFTFFMLILITSDNYVQLFLGWEGVGLCSYLLVNFWYTREQANKAAMKAIIVNRVGDFFLLMGLLAIFVTFKTMDFVKINTAIVEFEFLTLNIFNLEIRVIDLICFFIFAAAVGKSAQVGLHTWLPDAMEGPTPVSALIHAATMVTAGIFLVLRSSFLFEFSNLILNFITVFGTITAILASTSGIFQYDIKKVIAYSTSSQLGYMFLACGTSNYCVAIFHLYNHAFFKALLFLGAGSIIHALNDEQDMRKMGGLFLLLPFTFIAMMIGTIALIGLPFLTGFYSKDLIIETLLYKYNINFFFGCFLACLVAFFTSFYSFRLIFLVFINDYKGCQSIFFKIHDCQIYMAIPLCSLIVFTLIGGFLTKDLFVGISHFFWQQAFTLSSEFSESTEFLDTYLKILPFVGTLFGFYFSIIFCCNLYFYKSSFFELNLHVHNIILKNIFYFFGKKWLFDFFYNKYIARFVFFLAYDVVFKVVDRGAIELLGPLGIVRNLLYVSNKISSVQSGYIYHYFVIKFIGFFIFFVSIFSSFSYDFIFFLSVYIYLYLIKIF